MKLAKSLLLGSAAGLMAVAGANAADLPVRAAAPAVDYVRVCNAYGTGFFFIPGTETCLRIGGSVRAQITSTSPAVGTVARDRNYWGTGGSRAQIFFDTRTATEMGLLRTFTRLEYGIAPGVPAGPANLRDAYIQWGGLTVGRTSFSFFQFYDTSTMMGQSGTIDAFTQGPNVLAYTATFGGGFEATIALEDNPFTRGGIGGLPLSATVFETFIQPDGTLGTRPATVAAYGGTRMPDVVGRLRYSGGWGTAHLAGVVKEVRTSEAARIAGVSADKLGWAITGQVNVKLPMLAPGSEMWLSGAYGQGAVAYTGYTGQVYRGFTIAANDAYSVGTGVSLAKSWSIDGGLRHNWTPQFQSNIHAAYGRVDGPATFRDVTWWNVGTNVAWRPIAGLAFLAEVDYKSARRAAAPAGATAVVARRSSDVWAARLRVQRDF